MRKPFIRSVAVATAVILSCGVSACGSSSSKDSSKTTGSGSDLSKVACPLSSLPSSGQKVKINFWYADQQGKNKSIMQEIVSSYNASQDRVEVVASDQGQGYNSMLNKYTQAIQNDQIPNVMFADSSHAQFLVDSGTIIPGGACASQGVVPLAHIIPVVKRFYTIDGAYIPGAVNMASPMTYFNTVSFTDAGLPATAPGTLAQWRTTAEKIKAAHLPDMQWPISLVPRSGLFNTLVSGMGIAIVDHDNGHAGHATKAVFDTPKVVAAMKELQSMYRDGLIAKVSNTPGQLDQYLNVAQGKSATVFESSAAATTIAAFLGGGMSAKDLKDQSLGTISKSTKVVPGFGPMPGVEGPGQVPVTGGAYYVTDGGSKVDQGAAMDFIRYVNEIPQQIKWLIEGSYLSANSEVAKQPAVKSFFANTISGMALEVASNELAAVPAAKSGPILGPFEEYDTIMSRMMEAVLFTGADPAKALAKAQLEVTAAIENYNKSNGF